MKTFSSFITEKRSREERAKSIAGKLKGKLDKGDFERILKRIAKLGTSDVKNISTAYTYEKSKTRKGALKAMGQERLRMAHAKAKGDSAAKTRVW